MTYQITLEKTVGVYGHDAEGRPWTTFQIVNGNTTCNECAATIDRGWVRGKLSEEYHFCSEHIRLQDERSQVSND